MSVYLQFDSLTRNNPYIIKEISDERVWVPNDNYSNTTGVYQPNQQLIQTTTNYKVIYDEILPTNNLKTLGFLEHCKERPVNLTFSVESCVLIISPSAVVARVASDGTITYVSVLDEPYLYVKVMPIQNSEGNLIASNNFNASGATFILWCDKIQNSFNQSLSDPLPRPLPDIPITDINLAKWIIYKSCMITTMRLNINDSEWHIRIYDRFGNDVILPESDNSGGGFTTTQPMPSVDPDIQTMVLIGIRPNYPTY